MAGKDITRANITEYTLIQPMLQAVYEEFKEFSKKKQDGVINKIKIKHVNRILERVMALLAGESTTAFLDLVEEDAIPTNSDVVLIITQFVTALNKFKNDHQSLHSGYYRWNVMEEVDGDQDDVEDEGLADEDDENEL
ncbi:hypothetical protein SAMN05428988_6198 [Chitinophaga sp. YR573]|uniref:hypothetical protein n=1 Tax=Chitinophaga sp. YR573 TaxID=1881040 RepID=UPI0008D01F0E|nr:hypothetical protein [Chitinophaga sp. YR573]SEW45981.1 hypothetical protein SAMN05428988_6198 [Chitinophaga sp. YR573]